ncbi:MAG: LysR family transcriptional regulator [Alphaproteobacteria bacterium HGW-Alphaproteobacteria-4]|nr:MAG: LysR family transcriptional regulator [Alphaproteobacteria bacterium HGW-Alphaproteobacteria-4]
MDSVGTSGKGGGRGGERAAKVDISLLQTFHLVARTGSFSAASRELNISYQSAANHVRRLEQMYGARLIEAEKGSRRVTLTPQGRALHASLGAELETILSRISVLLHDVHSVLRVGVPQALFHHFFPAILHEFRAEAPDIELAFYERDTTLEKMMMDGALDAAVSERSFSHPAITQQLLGSYRLALVWPAEWNLPDAGAVPLGDELRAFRERPFVTYEAGQMVRQHTLDYLGQRMGSPPHIATSASGSTSVMRLIEAGLGYGVVPEWIVDTANPAVKMRLLHEMEPMKLWFAHTAFLGGNRFIGLLQRCCRTALA